MHPQSPQKSHLHAPHRNSLDALCSNASRDIQRPVPGIRSATKSKSPSELLTAGTFSMATPHLGFGHLANAAVLPVPPRFLIAVRSCAVPRSASVAAVAQASYADGSPASATGACSSRPPHPIGHPIAGTPPSSSVGPRSVSSRCRASPLVANTNARVARSPRHAPHRTTAQLDPRLDFHPPTHRPRHLPTPGFASHDAASMSGRPVTSAPHPTHRLRRLCDAFKDAFNDAFDAFTFTFAPALLEGVSSSVRSTNPAKDGGGGSA